VIHLWVWYSEMVTYVLGVDVIRSQRRNPQNFFVDWESTFDLLANVPESIHAGMTLWSDHGTPTAWRFNHGYGCHTYKWSVH